MSFLDDTARDYAPIAYDARVTEALRLADAAINAAEEARRLAVLATVLATCSVLIITVLVLTIS